MSFIKDIFKGKQNQPAPKRKSNSSFWMGDNLLDENSDAIEMNSYRRSIANFVRIVTGKQIPVQFNSEDHSFTDGETVVISGVIKNGEFDSAVGLACHEASHILLSNFKMLKELTGFLGGKGQKPFQTGLVNDQLVLDVMAKYNVSREYAEKYVIISLKNLLNWVEDRRIDYHIFSTSPGYKGYYHAMYDRYFHSDIVTKGLLSPAYRDETMSSYMFRIINLTNENRDLTALKGLNDIWNVVDLKTIDRLKSSEDALEVAKEIFDIIEKNVEGFDSQQEDQSDMQNSQDGEGEEGEGEGQGGGNGQPDPHKDFKGNDSSKSQPQGEQMEGDMSNADDAEGDEEGEGGKGQGEASDDTSDGEGEGEGEGGESGEGEGQEGQGSASEGDGKEGEGEGESTNKKGTNSAGGSGGKTGNGQPLTDEEAKEIKKAIAQQREFINHDIKKDKISSEKQEELKAVESSGSSLETVGKSYDNGRGSSAKIRKNGINCVVYRNMTKAFIESGACPFSYKNYWSGNRSDRGYEQAIVEGLQKGKILGKKMQVRQESRQTYYNRQKKGLLDNRLVAEAGFGNSKIFGHLDVEQYAPAYVHISIDASGSMSGKKFYQAQVASVAIAKAATMVQGLDCVISYRGCTNGKPAMMIAYDSRKDSISKIRNLFGAICPTGSTPEGLCFEAVLDEIVMGNSKQYSYFVNMSDGEPGFSGHIANTGEYVSYGGVGALNHTRDMVNKIRQRGVNVLSYFIGGGYSDHSKFKKMYGKDAAFVDVNNVMTIAKTMNKLFMKKANK